MNIAFPTNSRFEQPHNLVKLLLIREPTTLNDMCLQLVRVLLEPVYFILDPMLLPLAFREGLVVVV